MISKPVVLNTKKGVRTSGPAPGRCPRFAHFMGADKPKPNAPPKAAGAKATKAAALPQKAAKVSNAPTLERGRFDHLMKKRPARRPDPPTVDPNVSRKRLEDEAFELTMSSYEKATGKQR